MKSIVSVLIAVCLQAVFSHAQDPLKVTLRGRVIASETGGQLTGIEISIAGTNRRVITNEKGEFVFADLVVGQVELIIRQTRQIVALGKANSFIEMVLQQQASTVTDSITIRASELLNSADAAVEKLLTERYANLLASCEPFSVSTSL